MLKLDSLPSPALSISRGASATRFLTRPALVVTSLIAVSTVIRSLVAWQHQTPRYFPDEYIYATLGRSLAHGHYEIRGQLAHFPAILEPLLAAPLWRFFSTDTAYQLIQAQNALAVSLTAIPVYLLARWLGLGRGYGYLCAAYALVIPLLSLVAVNIADLIAYPLVLAALAAGVRALETPSPRRQLAFLAFATLATLARTQYFILVPAYVLAALLLERRRVFRRHKVAALALIPVSIAIVVAVFGFYSGVRSTTHINGHFFHWLLLESYLLALETGVAIVPGALIALFRPGQRRELVFSLFAGAFMVLLFCESAVYAANSDHFKERYLFSALPLIPLAYGLYLKRGRPFRYAAFALVAVLVIAASRLPISAYAISTLRTDSEFLYGVSWLEQRTSYGGAALAVALLATLGGAYAIWTVFKGDRGVAVVVAIAVGVAATLGSVSIDLHFTRTARSLLPRNLSWVDAASHGPVTAVATPYSSRVFMFLALYWNPSITREVALDKAIPTDSFAAPDLKISHTGQLQNTEGDVLMDGTVAAASFWNATEVAHGNDLSLWRPVGVPRFRTLIVGRYSDNWLNESARIRSWPQNAHSATQAAAVTFTLSLPGNWQSTAHMRVGESPFLIHPGSRHAIVCWNARGPLDVLAESHDVVVDGANRPLTAQLATLEPAAVPAGRTGEGCAAATSGAGSTSAVTRAHPAVKGQTASAAAPVQSRVHLPAL